MDTQEPRILTMTGMIRAAVDEHGQGPSEKAIRTYIADGLINPLRHSSGRFLFSRSDARLALQIYEARRVRHGATGPRS
jgi:hypothetical protein